MTRLCGPTIRMYASACMHCCLLHIVIRGVCPMWGASQDVFVVVVAVSVSVSVFGSEEVH